MRESKKLVARVTGRFVDAKAGKFPGICQDIYLEERDGFDAWVRVRVPDEMRALHSQILSESVDMTDQLWDSGVWVRGLVVQEKEPVHG